MRFSVRKGWKVRTHTQAGIHPDPSGLAETRKFLKARTRKLTMAKNILLVEDKKLIRMMISNGLKGYGINFFEADNGKDAIDVFRENQEEIDLVISDIHLPLLNGVESIRAMKVIKPNLPTIVLTSFTHKTIVLECVKLGVSAFLAKPLHMESLKEKVFDILDLREREIQVENNLYREVKPAVAAHSIKDLRKFIVDLAEAAG